MSPAAAGGRKRAHRKKKEREKHKESGNRDNEAK